MAEFYLKLWKTKKLYLSKPFADLSDKCSHLLNLQGLSGIFSQFKNKIFHEGPEGSAKRTAIYHGLIIKLCLSSNLWMTNFYPNEKENTEENIHNPHINLSPDLKISENLISTSTRSCLLL